MKNITRALIASVFILSGAAVQASAQSILKNHDTKQPIDISADRLQVKPKKERAIFSGAVTVTQGPLTIKAADMTVFYAQDKGAENPSIRRLDATGGVILTSDSETVKSKWAVYDVERRLVTLGGDVTMTRGTTEFKGERLELDLVSGLTKLDGTQENGGRVKGRFSLPKN